MGEHDAVQQDERSRLHAVIRLQTDVARLGPDLGAVMALVVERAQALTGADGGVVELAEGGDMVYRACSGLAAPHLGIRLAREGSLSGACVSEGQVLRCDDIETDPRINLAASRRIGLRSMLVVPLRHGSTVVGVLKVLSATPAAFDGGDADTLGLLADLVAAAIFHAGEQAQAREDLFFRATHDPLTGLPNRALFFERLHQCLALARREGRQAAVMVLDMNGLKPINDGLGHRAGDAALQAVAMRLRDGSRESDTVARLGGDEFAVILPRIEPDDGLDVHRQRLASAVDAPFDFEGRSLALSASIGGAVFPRDGGEPAALVEVADQAMYADKRRRGTGR